MRELSREENELYAISLASGFSVQDSLFDLAGCWHSGFCHYEQIKSVLLFLSSFYFPNIFWTYTCALEQSELRCSGAVVPLSGGMFSRLLWISNCSCPSAFCVTNSTLYFPELWYTWLKSPRPFHRTLPINLLQSFLIWKLWVFIGRDKGFLSCRILSVLFKSGIPRCCIIMQTNILFQ